MSLHDDLSKLPDLMREAFEQKLERGTDPKWVASMVRDYLDADEATRADIEAFFEGDGPRVVDELRLRDRDGTPTTADLEGWAEGGFGDLPEIVRESLRQLSPEDAREAARTYREATEEEREGMVAFLEGDGPETMRQLHVEREDGTPTSDELERWVEGEG